MTLTPLSINTASSCWIFLREFVPMLFVLPGWGVCSSPCSHREILWSHWLSITTKQIFTELIYGCCKWQNLELLQTSFGIVSGIFFLSQWRAQSGAEGERHKLNSLPLFCCSPRSHPVSASISCKERCRTWSCCLSVIPLKSLQKLARSLAMSWLAEVLRQYLV